MADGTKVALLGAAGFAVYWFYLRPATASTATPTIPTTPTPPPTGTGAGTTPPGSPPHLSCTAPLVASADGTSCVSPPPSLDQLYGQLVNAAGAAGVDSHNPDGYNWMLTQILQQAGITVSLPDPNQLFAGSGWSRPDNMPIAFYWSLTAPWLKQNKGLSGYGPRGLGCVGEVLWAGNY